MRKQLTFGNATFGFPASFGGEKSVASPNVGCFFQAKVVYDVNNRLTDRRQSRRTVCVFLKGCCELLYLRLLLTI